jgi:TPP-dependent pyruvate/acetoin dehydrogenase alpha subunit
VECYESKLLKSGALAKADAQALNKDILQQVQEAVDFALSSPLPAPEDAMADIFSV